MDEVYQKFLSMISSEFQRYLMEHAEDAATIPANALIIFRVQDEQAFNQWHQEASLRNREADQALIYVHVNKIRTHSLLQEVMLEQMAA
jgi:hypothetical protein